MKITTEVEIGATHIPEDVDVHLEPVTYRSHEELRDHVLHEIEQAAVTWPEGTSAAADVLRDVRVIGGV